MKDKENPVEHEPETRRNEHATLEQGDASPRGQRLDGRKRLLWLGGIAVALAIAIVLALRIGIDRGNRLAHVPIAVAVVLFVVLLFLVLLLVRLGYSHEWTGFGESSDSKWSGGSEMRPRKTLWDWLQLLGTLAVPVMVALVGIYFTMQQSRTQSEVEEQRAQAAALQDYLGQMSQLLLEEKLRTKEDGEARTLARARTMTVLEGLDPHRKGRLLQFLTEADLINGENPVLDLSGVDASQADLSGFYLAGTNLSGVNLSGANLNDATLWDTDLSCARPVDPRLRSSLTCTDLSGASLRGAALNSANLSCAEASVWWNEGKMNRSGCVDLSDVNLSGANLSDADLSGADLSGATGITNGQLKARVGDLEGATMPEGQRIPLGLPEKRRSSPSVIEIEPREYTTDEFKPAFLFKLGKGWVLPSKETPEELPIDEPPGPEAYPNQLRFINTGLVFDPSNPNERETDRAPANADAWASWFRSHPNLETSKPVQVSVGNASGVQIDVISSSKPGKYPKDCEQPCVSLFPSCNYPNCDYDFPSFRPSNSTEEREIVSYADSKDRFIIVDVEGETVVVDVKARADSFDEFLPKAQKVLGSVEWKGG